MNDTTDYDVKIFRYTSIPTREMINSGEAAEWKSGSWNLTASNHFLRDNNMPVCYRCATGGLYRSHGSGEVTPMTDRLLRLTLRH